MVLIAGQRGTPIADLLLAGLMLSFAGVDRFVSQTPLGTWIMTAALPISR
jgi:hypothetical protein